MKKLRVLILFFILLGLFVPVGVLAQEYLFDQQKLNMDVFVNEDGSISIGYTFALQNTPGGHILDYIDIGMPSSRFNLSEIEAEANGVPVSVSTADYQGDGSGFAVVMGSQTIPSGGSGTLSVWVPRLDSWLRQDSDDENYASFVISPSWFGKQYLTGATDMTVTIHLPPGVKPEEPRWHSAPGGFPSEPETGIDDQGRIYYRWNNPQASGWQENEFGASFPIQYVPENAITKPGSINLAVAGTIIQQIFCCSLPVLIFAGLVIVGLRNTRKRKLQYLPPKIAIEGLGIKRGLTAVEAAVLMEQPLDKVLTMILFGTLRKNAAAVTSKDPLEVKPTDPLPEDLHAYERDFLKAFAGASKERKTALQLMMIDIVKSLGEKMKGFSRKETIAYYKDITERAWKQVEAAGTPEVQSAKFEEVMEWTMLDKEYDDRTKRVLTGPVYIPSWWWRYDPSSPRPSTRPLASPTPSMPSTGGQIGGGVSMPTLPGATFAASIVNGVQNFSGGVVGDLTDFTSGVTTKTNPIPVTTSANKSTWKSGSSGGRSCACACACACAGCACACAGGGR